MSRPSLRLSVLLSSAAFLAAVAVPALVGFAQPLPAQVDVAYCYEVTVEVPGWQPSVEVCNLPEIGSGVPL